MLIGKSAGDAITTSSTCTIVGALAGSSHATGGNVTAFGFEAGAVSTNSGNTFIGSEAGEVVSTGYNNTFVGNDAGDTTTTGFGNVCVGVNTNTSIVNAEKQIVIGFDFAGNGDNKISMGSGSGYVWNSYTVNNTWTQVSDERTKKNIESDDLGLDFINELRPVTFNWRHSSEIDPEFIEETVNIGNGEKDTETLVHGLIAQEVKAAMDSVGNTTFNGWEEGQDGQAISREMFITPLIKAVQELSTEVTTLKSEIAALKGG